MVVQHECLNWLAHKELGQASIKQKEQKTKHLIHNSTTTIHWAKLEYTCIYSDH